MIASRLIWVAVLLALTVFPARAGAAPLGWRPTPQLTGEGVCGLASAGNDLVWAGGASGGVYLSRDGGATWHSRPVPEPQLPACPVAASPDYAHDHLVLAVTDEAYESTDGGDAWSPLSLPVTPSAIAFSPRFRSDGTIVAVSDTGPVYRSSDRGQTWTQVADWQAGLPAAGHFIVYSAAILPDRSVWLATGDGVYRSLDGGTTWAWANAGLPVTQENDPATLTTFTRVQRVAAVTSDGSANILVAALFAAGRGWLYRSTNAGQTWIRIGRTLSVRPTALAAIPDGASRVLLMGTHEAGVLVSEDGGAGWTPLGSGLGDEDTADLAAPDPGHILAGGSYDGVFRLSLSAGTWSPGFAGMPQADAAVAMAAPGGTSGALYAGTLSGVYRLSGGAWRPDNTGLPGERSITGLASAQEGPRHILFAATASGVYLQSGSGPWREVGTPAMRGLAMQAIAVHDRTIVAACENGLYGSSDGGHRWRLYVASGASISQLTFSPAYARDHTIYALDDGRLERYHAGHGALVQGYLAGSPIVSFAIAPRGQHVIMAATANGLYVATGVRWRRVYRADLGPTPVIRFLQGREVIVGTVQGVLLSRDGGKRWEVVATPHSAPVLALTGETGHRVAVSLLDGGVWHFALP